jgi:hypothetical protein
VRHYLYLGRLAEWQALCEGFLHPSLFESTGALGGLHADELRLLLAGESHVDRDKLLRAVAFADRFPRDRCCVCVCVVCVCA